MDEVDKSVIMQLRPLESAGVSRPFLQVLDSRSPHEFILDLDQDWNQFVDQLAREVLSWQSHPAD
jgi:hypothetical protein